MPRSTTCSKKASPKKATSKSPKKATSNHKKSTSKSPTPSLIRPNRSPRPKSNSTHPSEQARRTRKSTRLFEKLFTANEPPESYMVFCLKKLAAAYDDGLIVTFNPNTVQWEEVDRPYIQLKDGTMTSLHGYQFGSALPTVRCPHSLNPYRCLEECTMSLFRTADGVDYFQAKNDLHQCSLRVTIPVLNDPLSDEFPWEQDRYYTPSPEGQAIPTPFQAYFNRRRAITRATHDIEFCSRIETAYQRGDFSSGAVNHPTHDNTLPQVLRPWDLSLDPSAQRNTNHFTQLLGTDIGHAIRELHSTSGIPSLTWRIIRDDAVVCRVCSCVFSNAGYFDHIVPGGYCHNWYRGVKVFPETHQRHVTLEHAPSLPEGAPDWSDISAPSRAALIEWNSRIGVSQDVWALVSTMEIKCDECGMCRSYAAHLAHLVDHRCSLY